MTTFADFEPSQIQNILKLFGDNFLKKIEEMKRDVSAISSRKSSPTDDVSIRRNKSLPSVSIPGRKEENEAELYEKLLNSLRFIPSSPSQDDSKATQFEAMHNAAVTFAQKLELKDWKPRIVAGACFLLKTIAATACFCGLIVAGAFLLGTAASFIAPAAIIYGQILGGVISTCATLFTGMELGITRYHFFSAAHARAIKSKNIETTIKTSLEKNGYLKKA